MSFPRYPKYKDSGVEWLGAVPEHWDVVRLKALVSEVDKRAENVDFELLGLSKSLGVVKRTQLEQSASESDNYAKYKVAESGQLVMNKMQAWNGVFGICPSLGMVSPDYAVYQFIRSGYDKFLCALFRTDLMSGVFFTRCRGMGTAFLRLNTPDFLDIKVPLPPIDDARTISAFLDRETAKIDELVAEQRRLMELLKEKRQAVISHAVTQGLNPHAPMKPSDIEWLGDVPEHWDVVPLGMLATMIQTGPFGSQLHSAEYVENGTPVINPSNIQDGRLEPDWSCSITAENVERLSQHKLIEGDIIFGRRGEMGRCALVSSNEVGWICGTGSLNVRLSSRAFPLFVAIYLRTEYVREWLKLQSVGSTMDNLNTQILGSINVPVPPLEEQKLIASYLGTESTKFDTLTAETQRAIDLLQERRTALISAAVTGQIDVRNFVTRKEAA